MMNKCNRPVFRGAHASAVCRLRGEAARPVVPWIKTLSIMKVKAAGKVRCEEGCVEYIPFFSTTTFLFGIFVD